MARPKAYDTPRTTTAVRFTPEPKVIEGEWHEWANGRWQPMGWIEADDEVFA